MRGHPEPVTDLYGRTFATWTTVTCVLCVVCARNVSSPAIYGACSSRSEVCRVPRVPFACQGWMRGWWF
eukprot:scaffold2844_cov326-Pavlova_lutheri.AAC.22